MTILIDLGNQLMAEAIYQLLITNGYDGVVCGRPSANGFTPSVLLVDTKTLSHGLLAQYPDAKVLLIDTGMETEKLCATLRSYRIHGVLSPRTELQLLKKALKAVTQGEVWIDNELVKASFRDTGAISRPGKINGITNREQEIIACICRGLSNKEIAQRLTLSEHTVKSHLNRIFSKFHIKSRSKLITLAMEGPLARSA
jgi:DNA-binding NarL/FixJ family response regulator